MSGSDGGSDGGSDDGSDDGSDGGAAIVVRIGYGFRYSHPLPPLLQILGSVAPRIQHSLSSVSPKTQHSTCYAFC